VGCRLSIFKPQLDDHNCHMHMMGKNPFMPFNPQGLEQAQMIGIFGLQRTHQQFKFGQSA
jgi:hypothetical protein